MPALLSEAWQVNKQTYRSLDHKHRQALELVRPGANVSRRFEVRTDTLLLQCQV